MTNIYDIEEIDAKSPLIEYIPSFYVSLIGVPNVFVEVMNIYRIESNYWENINLESTGDNILSARGNTAFLVNIDRELEKLLNETLTNPEASFQYQVEQEDIADNVVVNDKPKDKPSRILGSGTNLYKRDYKTSKTAIVKAKNKCEINDTHEDFISRVTERNYVEAHHLIPMEYQDDFKTSIDVEANIVSLCVGCHKKLHHGTNSVIMPLIEKLYVDRIDRLKDCDIELTKAKLLSYYK